MSKSTGASFFAFLGGVVVGGLVAIMYAPEKGAHIRDMMRFRLDKYQDKLQEIIEKLGQGRVESINEAKSESQKVIADAIKHAESLMSEVDALRKQITVNENK